MIRNHIHTTDPHVTISEWFFKEPSVQQRDVAITNLFTIVQVEMDDIYVTIDLLRYDPYMTTMFIIYYLRPSYDKLVICGCISWDHVFQLNGKVSIQRDLTLMRSFIPSFYSHYDDMEDDDSTFVLHHRLPLRKLVMTAPIDGHFSWESVIQRADCILYDRHLPMFDMKNEFGSTITMALIEAAMEELFSIPNTDIDMTRHHCNFFRARMEMERTRFSQLFSPYASTESCMVSFVSANGMDDIIVDATSFDRQRFYTRISKTTRPIRFSFRVKFDTVPPQLATTLLIYPGGFMHLSYMDMIEWLFHQFYLQEQSVGIITGMLNVEPIAKEARRIARIMCTVNAKSAASTKRNVNRHFNRKAVVGDNTIVIDMDHLTSIVPACLKEVMLRPRFPRFSEAKSLIAAFKAAGLKKEILFEWFEKMNTKYPTTYRTALERFKYDVWWDTITYKTWCDRIQGDTRDGREDVVKCPFYSDVVDIEDMKHVCAPDEKTPFSGPHNLVRRYMFRQTQQQHYHQPEAEVVVIPVIESSSESESENESE